MATCASRCSKAIQLQVSAVAMEDVLRRSTNINVIIISERVVKALQC